MAAKELLDYIENGNIMNSVNYPNCRLDKVAPHRISIAHVNLPNMVGQFTSKLAGKHINISNMINQSRGDYAYSLLDIDIQADDTLLDEIRSIDGILNVRSIY